MCLWHGRTKILKSLYPNTGFLWIVPVVVRIVVESVRIHGVEYIWRNVKLIRKPLYSLLNLKTCWKTIELNKCFHHLALNLNKFSIFFTVWILINHWLIVHWQIFTILDYLLYTTKTLKSVLQVVIHLPVFEILKFFTYGLTSLLVPSAIAIIFLASYLNSSIHGNMGFLLLWSHVLMFFLILIISGLDPL